MENRTDVSGPIDGRNLVSAAFSDYDEAEEATRELLEDGFERGRIVVFLSEETRDACVDLNPAVVDLEEGHLVASEVELERDTKALEGAGVGAGLGGAIGAVAAAVAAIGTSVIVPALGIVVAGPLAAALAGAGAGGATGGLIGALAGAGMDEYRANRFAELIGDGHIVIGVHAITTPEHNEIERILTTHGGELIVPGGETED